MTTATPADGRPGERARPSIDPELRQLVIDALVAALVADVRQAQAAEADGGVRTENRPSAA